MTTRIKLGNISADVVFKDINNVHLSIYPPDGKERETPREYLERESHYV